MSVCAPPCGQVLTDAEVERVRALLVRDHGWDSVTRLLTTEEEDLVHRLVADYTRLRTRDKRVRQAFDLLTYNLQGD